MLYIYIYLTWTRIRFFYSRFYIFITNFSTAGFMVADFLHGNSFFMAIFFFFLWQMIKIEKSNQTRLESIKPKIPVLKYNQCDIDSSKLKTGIYQFGSKIYPKSD